MATKKKTAVETTRTEKPEEQEFDKMQITASERYRGQRDMVDALLADGKKYTIAAVDSMIEGYRKGQVK